MTADEAFTVGTAVVISPIGEAVHEGKTHTLLGDKGPITQDLYQTLNVVSPLHRKKILMEVAALRKAYLNP